jgi:hypothetical protein
MPALNQAQIEILKLFEFHQSEEELKRLKNFLLEYLFQRATEEADRVWEERGYNEETVEQWKQEHMRMNVDALKQQKGKR